MCGSLVVKHSVCSKKWLHKRKKTVTVVKSIDSNSFRSQLKKIISIIIIKTQTWISFTSGDNCGFGFFLRFISTFRFATIYCTVYKSISRGLSVGDDDGDNDEYKRNNTAWNTKTTDIAVYTRMMSSHELSGRLTFSISKGYGQKEKICIAFAPLRHCDFRI